MQLEVNSESLRVKHIIVNVFYGHSMCNKPIVVQRWNESKRGVLDFIVHLHESLKRLAL